MASAIRWLAATAEGSNAPARHVCNHRHARFILGRTHTPAWKKETQCCEKSGATFTLPVMTRPIRSLRSDTLLIILTASCELCAVCGYFRGTELAVWLVLDTRVLVCVSRYLFETRL